MRLLVLFILSLWLSAQVPRIALADVGVVFKEQDRGHGLGGLRVFLEVGMLHITAFEDE